MRRSELLAPAGTPDCVKAAVRCGADAVYLGTKDFNARRNAENFDGDTLRNTIAYCHAGGVKVHITLNTLVSDAQLPAALQVIRHVCALGADVLILQDLGLAALAMRCAPGLARHASTQTSVQTPQGVALLKGLGFSRAVLPRELTKDEIKAIRDSTDLELEVFIHGAQCMCVSGQCYLSAMLGARSGNRGLCAQPCRLAFSAGAPGRCDLSLKDLSLMDHLGELTALGVDSFKIEGRMKRPEYVAAAVTSARAAMDGSPNPEIDAALKAVFSRSGFTDGYYQNERGPAMFGIRTKEDVTAATADVLSSLRRLYDKEQPRVPVDFYFSMAANEAPSLSVKARGITIHVKGDALPEPAKTAPLTADMLRQRLAKCGGTRFYLSDFDCDLDDGLTLPARCVNDLRRQALEALEERLSSVKQVDFTDEFSSVHCSISEQSACVAEPPVHTATYRAHTPEQTKKSAGKMPKFHVFVRDAAQIPTDFANVEKLFLPLECEENLVESVKNRGILPGVHLPRGIFGRHGDVEKLLRRAKALGIETAVCPTLDGVAIAKKCGMTVFGGFSLNIFNSAAVSVLESIDVKAITLSPELTLAQAAAIRTDVPTGVWGYGRLPLMLTRNCPIRNVKTCAQCKNASFLTDRKGVTFPVRCRFGCSEMLNSRPVDLADKAQALAAFDYIELHFTTESPAEVRETLDRYRKGTPPSGEFTRGLAFRGVE
ncbi:MAG: U32 family peptidase [Clostridia bacterium]|nr:U32 family peptidase [Clostridia bacterium]